MADDISEDEAGAISSLISLAETDVALAQTNGLQWVEDGITKDEVEALGSLDLAESFSAGVWVADGITEDETGALGSLDSLRSSLVR